MVFYFLPELKKEELVGSFTSHLSYTKKEELVGSFTSYLSHRRRSWYGLLLLI